MDVRVINELVHKQSAFIEKLNAEVGKVIVGQKSMIERILIGLLTGGHVLLEGVPGLAKTLTVRTLADALAMQFQRIQFTPDLLPADIVGTVIYNQARGEFVSKQGPIFANLVLADEINRAPAKVQCALLEAMQERQVTIGDTTYPLPEPFLVMATQNPIEQEGTYPLPEAQVDRFMLMIKVGYPTREEERAIMDRMTSPHEASAPSRWRRRRRSPRRAASSTRSTSTRRSATTSSTSCTRRASRRRTAWPSSPTSSSSAPARARPSSSTSRRARTRSCATAATSRPRTSRRSASTCCATA